MEQLAEQAEAQIRKALADTSSAVIRAESLWTAIDAAADSVEGPQKKLRMEVEKALAQAPLLQQPQQQAQPSQPPPGLTEQQRRFWRPPH